MGLCIRVFSYPNRVATLGPDQNGYLYPSGLARLRPLSEPIFSYTWCIFLSYTWCILSNYIILVIKSWYV